MLVIFESFGGKAAGQLPTAYYQKSRFLRKFVKAPALNHLTQEMVRILDRGDKLAKTRNDLMHGVATHVRPVDGRYVFSKIDYHPTGHTYRDVIFDTRVFPKLSKDLLTLGAAATRLGIAINQAETRLLSN